MWISTDPDGTALMFCRHWCATLAGAAEPSLSAPVEDNRKRQSCAHCAHCGWMIADAAADGPCWMHADTADGCPARRPELMLTMAAAARELSGYLGGEHDVAALLVEVESALNERADVHRYASAETLVTVALRAA